MCFLENGILNCYHVASNSTSLQHVEITPNNASSKPGMHVFKWVLLVADGLHYTEEAL